MHESDISFYKNRILQLEAELNHAKSELAQCTQIGTSNLNCEEYFQLLFEVAFEGLVIHENLVVIDVNAAISKIFGYERSALIGRNVLDFVAIEDRVQTKAHIQADYLHSYEVKALKHDGSEISIELQGKTIEWRGQFVRVTAVRDLSDRKKYEAALLEGERRYQALIAAKCEAVFIHAFDSNGAPGNFLEVNDAACESLGYSKAELVQMSPREITPKDYNPPFDIAKKLAQGQNAVFEAQHLTKDGRVFPVEIRTVLLDTFDKNLVIDFARDISDRKAMEAKLERIASFDYLTQVANRRQFDQYLESEWQKAWRGQTSISLIMCDIDCYKLYNDRYGHPMGDKCLQQVATAIANCLKRPADLLARYGGEEFGIILPATKSDGAFNVAETIRIAVRDLGIEHEKSIVIPVITISLGISTSIPASDDFSTLIKAADYALYNAKQSGRDRSFSFQ